MGMINELELHIAEEFTDSPGARYYSDGPESAEQFLNEKLEPKFKIAMESGKQLYIYLDDVWGYPSSFISGSFGKLSLKYGSDTVLNHLSFISSQSRIRLDKIIHEIRYPTKKDN